MILTTEYIEFLPFWIVWLDWCLYCYNVELIMFIIMGFSIWDQSNGFSKKVPFYVFIIGGFIGWLIYCLFYQGITAVG